MQEDSPVAVFSNKLQREHAASVATTTRTLEVCQKERPTGDVAGEETEVGEEGRDSSEPSLLMSHPGLRGERSDGPRKDLNSE